VFILCLIKHVSIIICRKNCLENFEDDKKKYLLIKYFCVYNLNVELQKLLLIASIKRCRKYEHNLPRSHDVVLMKTKYLMQINTNGVKSRLL